jgi:hypothetical protein
MPDTVDTRDKCPVCGREYTMRCRCPRGDMVCEIGHEWHTCTVHNKVIVGPANHLISGDKCTCKSESRE